MHAGYRREPDVMADVVATTTITTTTTTTPTTITTTTTTTITYATNTYIGLPCEPEVVRRSEDGATIVHRPFSAEELHQRAAHNSTLPVQNLEFSPPPLQWRLNEDVDVSFDLTVTAPAQVWVMWAHCPHSGSDEVPAGTTRVTRSFVVDQAALVKQLLFAVGIGGKETEYTYKLSEAVFLNDLTTGVDLFQQIRQPITIIGTSVPPGSTISQQRQDFSHLLKGDSDYFDYNSLGIRYQYELATDAVRATCTLERTAAPPPPPRPPPLCP